ncbi:MAG: hypothetical protein ACR2KP_19475, partial [Egibacteraceae bacterium]
LLSGSFGAHHTEGDLPLVDDELQSDWAACVGGERIVHTTPEPLTGRVLDRESQVGAETVLRRGGLRRPSRVRGGQRSPRSSVPAARIAMASPSCPAAATESARAAIS